MSTELKPACGWPHYSEHSIVDIRWRQGKRCMTEYAISGNDALCITGLPGPRVAPM